MYGDVPGLEFVQDDATAYMRRHPGSTDVCYSVFGALDFSDPRDLLPAIATALRPGGTLVIATLGHYRNGSPPETDVTPAHIPVQRPDGTGTTMTRWVLDIPVWEKLLSTSGFTGITTDTVRDPGTDGEPPMATSLIRTLRR
jgi:SAM-dependent methyltransferase